MSRSVLPRAQVARSPYRRTESFWRAPIMGPLSLPSTTAFEEFLFPLWVETLSSVRKLERPLARSRSGSICAVGRRQTSTARKLSVSFLDLATIGSGLLRALEKRIAEKMRLCVHCASGGVLFDVFPDFGDHD